MSGPDTTGTRGIAIIGVNGRFPGAANVEQYWRNIAAGVESISTFSDDELTASGSDVAELRSFPGFVPARGVVVDADLFDAGFFGVSGTEAAVIDPQQRLFLEASWELLESAGYDPETVEGLIGVYAGMGGMGYYLHNLQGRKDIIRLVGDRVVSLGNDKDFLATRVAYKLNLKGPALNINTACSTSLVTVCQACQELMSFQCDLALAGGISITFPQKSGVYYQEGGVFSPDGHCRPFDAQAQGTVSSDGLGIVLLKRLADAIEDGDQIHAVIRGFGRNNDGSGKVGFTAPSVDGQAEAILTAQAMAGFNPSTITYVEAHGTATPLGDPIEIAALTQAFRYGTEAKNFCAIGSVKGNIGHTNTASGIAGLLKTVLALRHRQLPPTVHFTSPNPKIDFADSPFFVNTQLTDWNSTGPRRAGVSSFGLGGTNAHVVLEEAPDLEPSAPSRGEQLLVLSAKNPAALDAATGNLLAHLKANPSLNFADAAYTLQVGRRHFSHRRCLVCRDANDAAQALEASDPKRIFTQERDPDAEKPEVVFMFPGQGSQYVGMGADLYRDQPVFKEEIDRCAGILAPALAGHDLRDVLYPAADKTKEAEELLIQTRMTQPALFAIEYALAKLWMSWGVQPAALTGHSLGEYVAACLAGVFSLEEALSLVAQRGRLIQSMPRGSMLAVSMPEAELAKILPPGLSIAGVNGPLQCVVSGPVEEIASFETTLKAAGKPGRPLHTSHAFHSAMMDPVVEPFAECVRRTKRSEPSIPFISNVTGTWITPGEAVDPHYWARHLRQAVRFADGIRELLKKPNAVFLEVGPGTTLGSLTKFQAAKADNRAIVSSLRHAKEGPPDLAAMLTASGQLWMRGVKLNWPAIHGEGRRHRVTLPGYPFQRQRYWIEPAARVAATSAAPAVAASAPTKAVAPVKAASNGSVPQGDVEQAVTGIWKEILGVNEVGVDDNFFDLGGDSLLLMRVQLRIQEELHVELAVADMFECATIAALARRLGQGATALANGNRAMAAHSPGESSAVGEGVRPLVAIAEPVRAKARTDSREIAIIGISGRFPGANTVEELWRNLMGGVDSTSFFTDEELASSGLNVAEIRANRSYVPARGIVDRAEWFDAGFFGIGAKEAQIMDPQQRLFLEHAWEALEHAGYDPSRYPGHVGVFAGMAGNTYFLNNLQSHPELVEQVGRIPIFMGNDKDFLATRVAYKLNLKGPAISLGTACSTSLVAVALACQSLNSQLCGMALAGGVSVRFPQRQGNLHQEGNVFSRDGRCRPFDADASGTFFSDGLGIVVLKRLEDAIRDGDQIYSVIKGVGLNNDGADKVGYTAPSIQGQAEAIRLAHADAGISPETISYVEAHGTATALGDPIEVSALTQAFRAGTQRKGFCAIGSIKGNFGHCDSAAGVVGLIKTSLALQHRQLPASLHYSAPNPRIDFANSPFFVNTKLTEWQAGATPRRAGISSFGIGGTNVHLVVEEAPAPRPTTASRPWQLLLFSARNAAALDAATARFVAHLKANPHINLADAAYTLQVGRRAFPHRRMVVCRDVPDAIAALQTLDPERVITRHTEAKDCPVVFMFPGQGGSLLGVGGDLYRAEPAFRAEIDRCAEILATKLGQDIRPMLFPAANAAEQAEAKLSDARLTQTALFILEYALARLWMSWGINPQAMLSHSMGEFAAACVAGVFSLEEALNALVQAQPPGAMMAVRLPESDLLPLPPAALSIAALNSSALPVVAGPREDAERFETELRNRGVVSRWLENSHALHSTMMEPVVDPFAGMLEKVRFEKPTIPYVSNVTGQWVGAEEATNPRNRARQVSQTVRFADSLDEIMKDPQRVLLEVGPGRSLTTFASQNSAKASDRLMIASLPSSPDGDIATMLDGLGRLWLAGKTVNWDGFYAHESRLRIPLPTYPFQRERYWIEPGAAPAAVTSARASSPAAGLAGEAAAAPSERHARPEMTAALAMPASGVENKLVEIWQEVFGLKEVGTDDSFFDLGGDSLLAVPLIAKINATLGCELQIPAFFENPTIRKLAPLLGELASAETVAQPSTGLGDEKGPFIITFQKKGSRPPFFFLHGDWAGGGFYCGRLLEKLGGDQPFYTLPPYRSGRTEQFPFEEMVDKYYKAIRAHTPRGPYIMGGYCIGGILALEVARRFVEEGDEVLHLFQIDVPWRSTAQARWLWRGIDRAGNLLGWDLVKKIKNYDRYPLGAVRWLKMPLRNKLLALGRRLKLTTAGSTDPKVLGVRGGVSFEVFDGPDYNLYILASILHGIEPFNIPTSVYVAEEGPSLASRKQNAHGKLLNATFESIPGNHTTCITSHANVPAEKIAQVLDAKFPRSSGWAPILESGQPRR